MNLFNGIACFSPSVPDSVKEVWTAHGGIAAVTHKERQVSRWVFCNGIGDPWLAKFSAQPVIVFHANWILASAISGFPLPLAKYVLDDRFIEFNNQQRNIQSKCNRGSHRAGTSRELPQINPEINNFAYGYSLSTRLTTASKGKDFRKRPHKPSPEHRSGDEGRLNKKKLRSVEVLEDSGSELGKSGSQRMACEQTSNPLSGLSAAQRDSPSQSNAIPNGLDPSVSSIPIPSVIREHKSRGVENEQSGNADHRQSESIISSTSITDHDHLQSCEDMFSKGQVPKDMGFFVDSLSSDTGSSSQLSLKSPGSDGVPEDSLEFLHNSSTSADRDIWAYLIRQSTSAIITDSDATDAKALPTIRVSDALVALKKLNAKSLSDGNDGGAVLFVKGRMHCGRKFAVDKVDDRRKTI